ncbi:MAG: hypothetical protein IJ816_00905 [Alloprevotella sp.]|nr:hypothetical protein [Alloprevotella sp.]
MSLYIRYFDHETLVQTAEEAIEFLTALSDFDITEELCQEIYRYVENTNNYPKRYKIRPRVYFILIKTDVNTLEEFKAHRKNSSGEHDNLTAPQRTYTKQELLEKAQKGWYQASLLFKRVISIGETNKFQYINASFDSVVYAESALDCYNRIVAYLSSREDIDARSQFPSAKGSNYRFLFLGEEKPVFDEA